MEKHILMIALLSACLRIASGAVVITDHPDPYDISTVTNLATANVPVLSASSSYSRFGLDAGEDDWQTFTIGAPIHVKSLYYAYNDYRASAVITLSFDLGNDGSDDYTFTGLVLTNLAAGGNNAGPVNYLQFDLSDEDVSLPAGMHRFKVACTAEEVGSASFTIAPIRNSMDTYAGGASKYFEGTTPNDAIFAITSVEAIPLTFGTTTPADGDYEVAATPTVSCEVIEISDTLDNSSIVFTFDEETVAHSISKAGTTSTVSYAVSTDLPAGSRHTARLVVSGMASGPFTNTWSFKVTAIPANKTYVDATDATTSGNTLIWSDSSSDFVDWYPSDVYTNWNVRTGFGNEGAVYESNEDSGRLKTTVTGLPDATYNVYAYFWASGGAEWRMAAALTNNPSGTLPLYNQTNYPSSAQLSIHYVDFGPGILGNWNNPSPNPYYSTNLVANQFGTNAVMIADANRRLVEIYLGQVTGTEISVYVDDEAFPTVEIYDPRRTWYDGIGYEKAGLSTNPDIAAISVSGSTVSLIWASEAAGTYSILRKTNLTDSTWTTVKTDIHGGNPNTTDSIPASGADQEFFKIEGN